MSVVVSGLKSICNSCSHFERTAVEFCQEREPVCSCSVQTRESHCPRSSSISTTCGVISQAHSTTVLLRCAARGQLLVHGEVCVEICNSAVRRRCCPRGSTAVPGRSNRSRRQSHGCRGVGRHHVGVGRQWLRAAG